MSSRDEVLLSAHTQVSGIALDDAGNLVGANQAASYKLQAINVFSPPNWKLTSQFGGPVGAAALAFVRTEGKIFAAYANGGAVIEFTYPSGAQVNEIIDGLTHPQGVAVSPRAPLDP